MRISPNTVATIANILPSLCTLQTGAARLGNRADHLVVWRPETETALSQECITALESLVVAGHAVKLFEGERVLTPYMNAAGDVVWHSRVSKTGWTSPVIKVRLTPTPVALVVDLDADQSEVA
jgi:hypothetical protein